MRMISALVLLTVPVAAHATSFKDFWQSRPADDPHFQSAKTAGSLEECIALDMSEKIGIPLIIHGENEVLITVPGTGFLGRSPIAGARIVDHGALRDILVGALHTGGWRDKTSAIVRGCI